MNFNSNADEIRHYILEFLSEDNEAHPRTEIFNYVLQQSGKNFTLGMLTGALKALVDNSSNIICFKRGWYRVENPNTEQSLILQRVLKILKEAKSELNDACTVNLLNASPQDLEVTDEIAKMLRTIDETIKNLS